MRPAGHAVREGPIDVPISRSSAAKMRMEEFLLLLHGSGTQTLPPTLERRRIRRDHPRPPRHHAGAVVHEEVVQRRIRRPRPLRLGQEGRAPLSVALLPPRTIERERLERLELLPPVRLGERPIPHRRRHRSIDCRRAGRHHDADRLLHPFEDPRAHLRLMPLGRAVDHPDLVGAPAQIVAHTLEAGPVEEPRHGDEADDAVLRRRIGIGVEHLPRRPAPEVDVEIPQMLRVRAHLPSRRRHPVVQGCRVILSARLHPAALALRLLLVRRVPDHDGDRLFALDAVRLPPRLGDRLVDRAEVLRLDPRIGERVRHVHVQRFMRHLPREFREFRDDPQLRDGVRAQLQFERDEALDRVRDRSRHRAGPIDALHLAGDLPQHAKQIRSRTRGRVRDRDARRREPARETEPGPQPLVHEPDHRLHDRRRRVVRAGLLAERVVVDLEEVFVEIEPGVRVALADFRPLHDVEHANERAEGGLQRPLVLGAVGQQAQRGPDQRVGRTQLLRDHVESARQRQLVRASHEKPERDRLRVAIGEMAVGGFGEQQPAPVGRERRERGRASLHLLGHLIAEQAA